MNPLMLVRAVGGWKKMWSGAGRRKARQSMTTEEQIAALQKEYNMVLLAVLTSPEEPPRKSVSYLEALKAGIIAIRAQQERENPKPLTMEDMLKMDGEYIWLIDKNEDMTFSGWAVCTGKKIYYFYFNENCPIGCASRDLSDKYDARAYGKEWFAYRCPPKEDAKNDT